MNIFSVKDDLECSLRYKADCCTMCKIDCWCFICSFVVRFLLRFSFLFFLYHYSLIFRTIGDQVWLDRHVVPRGVPLRSFAWVYSGVFSFCLVFFLCASHKGHYIQLIWGMRDLMRICDKV